MNIKTLGVREVKATQMRSIDEVAALMCVCRGTVNNHIKAYDEAIAEGHKPPPRRAENSEVVRPSFDSCRRSRRGARARSFRRVTLPPAPKKPRGRPFQRRRQPVAAE